MNARDILLPEIFHGDCLDMLRRVPAESVDLIMTSPPYGEQRSDSYGGVPPAIYPEWFCGRAEEMRRVLKPTGSLIAVMGEYTEDGQRTEYADSTKREMRRRGWRHPETYIWHKKNGMPVKDSARRFRNAWEYCYQFTVSKQYKMNKDAVKVPPKPSTIRRYNSKSAADARRRASGTGSGLQIQSFSGPPPKMVYPDNVLHMPAVTRNTGHPAAFPLELPTWFIKVYTDPGDMVLDPFMGGGTTLLAAVKLGRRAVGIELQQKYCDGAREKIAEYAKRESAENAS